MHSSLYLSALLVVPLLGALVAMAVRKTDGLSYLVGLVTSIVEFALSIVVFVLYNNHIKGAGTFDFMSRHVLSAPLGRGLRRGGGRHLAVHGCAHRAGVGARPAGVRANGATKRPSSPGCCC